MEKQGHASVVYGVRPPYEILKMTPVPVFPYKSEPNTENWIGVPGAGKTVPIIVSRADGSYYVHTSTTASRTNKGKTYVTISDHLSQSSVKDGGYISGAKYDTLAEAYSAYEKLVKESYSDYKETLLK